MTTRQCRQIQYIKMQLLQLYNKRQSGCFNFSDSNELLFRFRGKTIYQSIINQLLADHGLTDANKLILAGSSAEGLGVINHAKWTRSVLSSTTELTFYLIHPGSLITSMGSRQFSILFHPVIPLPVTLSAYSTLLC